MLLKSIIFKEINHREISQWICNVLFLARLNMLFSYKNMENPKDNIQTWNSFYILVCVGNTAMITYISIISLKLYENMQMQ